MSTYTDTKNRIKETINVAHHPGYLDDRVTIQKVRLLNEENEYWGTFKGTSELNNTVLSNSTIYNTILKDVVLSGRIEAQGIDLLHVSQDIIDINQHISNLSTELRNSIDADARQLDNIKADINELSVNTNNDISAISATIDNLTTDVDNAIKAAEDRVNENIIIVENELLNTISLTKTELSNALTTEQTERIANDVILKTNIDKLSAHTDERVAYLDAKIDRDKHYDLNQVDSNTYPFELKDFSVNQLRFDIPNGKVVFDGNEIGYINRNDDGTINFTVFTLTDSCLYEALEEGFTYTLGTSSVDAKPGYILTYDEDNNCIKLASNNKKSLNIVDVNTTKVVTVGKVVTFKPDSDTTVENVTEGNITIYSSTDAKYNAFACRDKAFNNTDLSVITLDNNKIIYNGNNELIFKKNISLVNYCSVTKADGINNIEIARIYDGDVKHNNDETIKSVTLHYLDDTYTLNKHNKYDTTNKIFGEQYDNHGKVAIFDADTNKIHILDNIQYSYELKAALDKCILMPVGKNIHLENYDLLDAINAKILIGGDENRTLEFILTSTDKIIWTSEHVYDDINVTLTATFNSELNTLNTTITKAGDYGQEIISGTFIFDLDENTPAKVEKLAEYTVIEESNPITFEFNNSTEYVEQTFTAIINANVVTPETKQYELAINETEDVLKVKIQNRDDNLLTHKKAREFILTTDLTPTDKTRNIKLEANETLTDGVNDFVKIHLDGLKHIYQFKEIEDDKFLVVDLTHHELSTRIEALEFDLAVETANRIADVEYLSTTIDTLCADAIAKHQQIDETINELSINTFNAISDLSVALSTEIDTLCVELSGEIDTLSASLSNEIDSLCVELSNEIDKLSTALSTEIDDLSAALSNEIDMLSTSLSTEIDSLSTALSNEIDNLCVELSTTTSAEIFEVSTLLYNEIRTNTINIQCISSDLYDVVSVDLDRNINVTNTLSTHYYNTLSGIDRLNDHNEEDIKTDNLIITDTFLKQDHTHDEYYLTFLSGTLVLKKIEK